MEAQTDVDSHFGGVLKFFCHPIIGSTLGIIGIVLAIYFYYAGHIEPKLMLLLNPVRSPIVQAGKLSEFTVLFNGKPIQGDLTAAQFIIWNSGKAPVRQDDILKPIILMTTSNRPIYEATIRHVTRDVVGFQLITNDIAAGRLGVTWKIMEHNDGASIQVIYGGDQKLAFHDNDAAVVGQKHILYQYLNVNSTSWGKRIAGSVIFGFLAFATATGFTESIKKVRKQARERTWKDIWEVSAGAVFWGAMTILFCLIIFALFIGNNAPPFDF